MLRSVAHAPRDAAPALLLANELGPQIDPAKYLVSEKYDGVRAIWDGKELRFRSGRPVNAPAWFIAKLPAPSAGRRTLAGARPVRDALRHRAQDRAA